MPKFANGYSKNGGFDQPSPLSRARRSSRYCPQRSAITTSPMLSPGSTPPAIPEKRIRSMWKRSSASCTVIAAFTTLMPLRKRTTSRASRAPATNSMPFTECTAASSTALLRMTTSGANADTTAVRGVASSASCAAAGRAAAASSRVMAARPPVRCPASRLSIVHRLPGMERGHGEMPCVAVPAACLPWPPLVTDSRLRARFGDKPQPAIRGDHPCSCCAILAPEIDKEGDAPAALQAPVRVARIHHCPGRG